MTSRFLTSLLILTVFLPTAHGQDGSWYVELGAGPTFSNNLIQEGFNHDTICHSGYICDHLSQQRGYGQTYQIPVDPGVTFRIGAGREQGRLRVDLNAQYSSQNLGYIFDQISWLDGFPALSPDLDYVVQASVTASIGALRVASLRINTFLNLSPQDRSFRPYLGIGTGVSRTTITGFYHEERFSCIDPPCDVELSRFDLLQDENLGDTILLTAGHVGLEYVFIDKILVGIRLSYTLFQNFNGEGSYIEHQLDDLTNTTTFSKLNLITTMATVRYRL